MIQIEMTPEHAKRILAAIGEVMVARIQSADATREESPVLARHFDAEASTLAAIYCAISTITQKEA